MVDSATSADETGNKSEADLEIERLNADTERINKAIAENERVKALQQAGGISEAGSKTLTQEESETKEAKELADEISGAFV